MTYAPQTIRDLAALWVAEGGVNLGIVGDTRHQATGTSYHLGEDQLSESAYSRVTTRDRNGLSNAASAIDLGRLNGSLLELQKFSSWLVDQARANAPGTEDMREIIYSPDGATVWRWDRERGYSSAPMKSTYVNGRWTQGDTTHRTHTHISWYRDAERLDHTTAFRPYFQEEDMPLIDFTLPQTEVAGEITVKEGGASVVTADGGDRPTLKAGMVRPALGGMPGTDDQLTLAIRGDLPHYLVFIGTKEIGFVLASQVEFKPYGSDTASEDALLAAKREGYDLARAGYKMAHPAPTVTWPPRP